MNEVARIEEIKDRTPIEIALEVDENGWTTAKKLYSWLELSPQHYAEWVEERILKNPYINETEFSHLGGKTSDKGGRPSEDYAISGSLAKMLAISSKSKKGIIAQNYFIKLENVLKVTVKQYNELVSQVQKYSKALIELSDQTNQRLSQLESVTSASGGRISEWIKETSSDVMELADYCDCPVKEMYSRIIRRMEEIYGIFFQRYFDDYVSSHPNEKPVWRIVVIEYYDLKSAFEDAYIKIGKEVGLYPNNNYDEDLYEF